MTTAVIPKRTRCPQCGSNLINATPQVVSRISAVMCCDLCDNVVVCSFVLNNKNTNTICYQLLPYSTKPIAIFFSDIDVLNRVLHIEHPEIAYRRNTTLRWMIRLAAVNILLVIASIALMTFDAPQIALAAMAMILTVALGTAIILHNRYVGLQRWISQQVREMR